MDKILIKQKEESKSQAMTGRNTEVFLNGERLKGVTKLSFTIDSTSIARVKLEMITKIRVEGSPLIEEVNYESKKS